MQVKQESARVPKPPKKGNGGDPPEGKDGDRGSPDKGRGPPRRNNSQAGGFLFLLGEMTILTLVMMGARMILLPQTPLPQEKENIKVLNMCMYSNDLLDQKVKRVSLVEQEEMVEMGRMLP